MELPKQTKDIGDWASGIYRGDCTEVLQRLPADSIHTVITSPPYWQTRDYEVDGQLGREDTVGEYISNLLAVIKELYRVLRGDGSLWLVLGDTYVPGGQQTADANSPNILPDATLTEYEARRNRNCSCPSVSPSQCNGAGGVFETKLRGSNPTPRRNRSRIVSQNVLKAFSTWFHRDTTSTIWIAFGSRIRSTHSRTSSGRNRPLIEE